MNLQMQKENPNRKIVMLVVTESCNLNCIYCYQGEKSSAIMTLDIAKERLNHHFNNSDDFEEIEIDLFGGEPFIYPNFIIGIVEWVKEQQFNKPFIFFASTNGTKIHGEIQEWLIKNKEYIWLSLSIDGLPETHNLNRSNSYSQIDIDFFKNTYPLQDVRMTINENSLSKLFDNIVHLHDLGFIVNAVFAQDVKWENKDNQQILLREISKLCEYYINNPNIPVCSILDLYLPSILVDDKILKKENTKWCGTGTAMVAIDINGNEYPCQAFLPSTMPKDCSWDQIDFNDNELFSSDDCKECLIRNICGTCYGINIRSRGNITKRDMQLCDFNKIVTLGTSYLLGKKFELEQFGKYDTATEKLKAIEAIERVQESYSPIYKL